MAYSEERDSVFSQGACSLWEELQKGSADFLEGAISVGAVQSQCSDVM